MIEFIDMKGLKETYDNGGMKYKQKEACIPRRAQIQILKPKLLS